MVPRRRREVEHPHLRQVCVAAAVFQLSGTVSRSTPDLWGMVEEEIARRRPQDLARFFDCVEGAKVTILESYQQGIL